jgi:hypothetical protein
MNCTSFLKLAPCGVSIFLRFVKYENNTSTEVICVFGVFWQHNSTILYQLTSIMRLCQAIITIYRLQLEESHSFRLWKAQYEKG